MTYKAPVQDMLFTLQHICKIGGLADSPQYSDTLSDDLLEAVLVEAGKLTEEVIAPLNVSGDQEGCKLDTDGVKTASGFKQAYDAFVEGGWMSLPGDPDLGGQGMPLTVAAVVQEMLNGANMSFSLCPMLSTGAIEAIKVHASDELKQKYLPKMISGEWTGSMNLTEPQAGSDVGALRTKAVPVGDGTYKITGTKIFITFGDHDLTDNIIHLVLARLPDAPEGSRGISLFIVPKFFVNEDGSLGARNDAKAVGVEHKLGIHASPTCVMAYGEDNGGAIGWLVGQENRGLAAMFTMMNHARLNVGLQGVGICEAAYQQALEFSQERKQGKASAEVEGSSPIIDHADVRRMLMTMKARTEASRAICYLNAIELDRAHALDDVDAKAFAQARADLLTPISKAWSTDMGVECASLGVQIHGGMGFVEETGAAQYYRDARIAPIYEGTNGIQAMDLVNRKLPMKDGAVMDGLLNEVLETADKLASSSNPKLVATADALKTAVATAKDISAHILARAAQNRDDVNGAAAPYLRMMGVVLGGWLLAEKACVALEVFDADNVFARSKVETAIFFAEQLLPEVSGLALSAKATSESLFSLDAAALAC